MKLLFYSYFICYYFHLIVVMSLFCFHLSFAASLLCFFILFLVCSVNLSIISDRFFFYILSLIPLVFSLFSFLVFAISFMRLFLFSLSRCLVLSVNFSLYCSILDLKR